MKILPQNLSMQQRLLSSLGARQAQGYGDEQVDLTVTLLTIFGLAAYAADAQTFDCKAISPKAT
jgi:hypothetical protein